jgi:hypothetical protein
MKVKLKVYDEMSSDSFAGQTLGPFELPVVPRIDEHIRVRQIHDQRAPDYHQYVVTNVEYGVTEGFEHLEVDIEVTMKPTHAAYRYTKDSRGLLGGA